MMKLKTREREELDQQPLKGWDELASETAKRFKVPIPDDASPPAEVERKLRQLEQEDGE